MHGAYAGLPRGNRNPWKHGGRSSEMLPLGRQANELLRGARDLFEEV